MATRTFDNFRAFVPALDAVMFAGRHAELATSGMTRDDATGAAPGPISSVICDLPRIPPSGLEARPVQLLLKFSRGDLDQLPDTHIDNITVQVHCRPCWLFAPSAD